jgi:ABC-2 type transport system ATP-binding protein
VRLSRWLLVAAGAALAVVLGATGAVAVTSHEPAVRTEVLRVPGVPEPRGGPVSLDATLYLPDVAGPVPAVVLAHGFGGSKNDLADDARQLAQSGYVVLAYTARGFGASGGLVHLDAPDYEVADARRMLDVLAGRPEVLMDAPGDPRVGVTGGSYGGALALLLAGYDRRVDAIAPQITWNDLRQALFPQFTVTGTQRSPAGVEAAGSGVFKKAWAGVFFGPGGAGSGAPAAASAGGSGTSADGAEAGGVRNRPATFPDFGCGRFAPDVCHAYQQVAATGQATPEALALLRASSPATVLDRITAPTLLVQGEADSLFPLSEADANARGIAAHGAPVKVVWYGGGHDGGLDETDRLRSLVLSWFGRYLERDGSAPDMRFEVTVRAATISRANSNPAPQVRVAPAEPGIAPGGEGVATRVVLLSGPAQPVVAPAGGSPAALTALPGLGSALGALAGAGLGGSSGSSGSAGSGGSGGGSGSSGGTSATGSPGFGLSALPGQVAVFESAPLTQPVRIVGASRVHLRVSAAGSAGATGSPSSATLFAQLYDVPPSGGATLPEQLVSPMRLSGLSASGQDVTVSLPAVVRDVAAGHRLRLVVSTTDQAYALPAQPAQYVVALAGTSSLTVPVVPMAVLGGAGLGVLLPWALALLVATALVVVAFTVAGRRRTRSVAQPDLARVPLAVERLGKRYGDGFRAVTDVSFQVERGWVLGLLGPNGAGKTTVLRMLMGLITPTEGQIAIFGHAVRPGAPVLSRVGSFVEGPGFLPHVSGLENLRLYWAATGRPWAQAHVEEALEIAGLGDDVRRRVRTYSHGMRQRLAIAQAMLGLPDLLVLDEPTNGLDPPQIREMREVLTRYAATGRTVVLSSHVLAEVEQTSTHVVVMNQGRLVAQGPVAELVGSATSLVVDVDRPGRAAEVAACLDGARDVEITPTGITLKLVGTPRSELVRVLVADGLSVNRITPQRGLEEAFLALVGED